MARTSAHGSGPSPAHAVAQRAVLEELHREERVAVGRDAGVVDAHDVRVPRQAADRLALLGEPALLVLVEVAALEHLQRDGAVERELARAVDDGEAAATDLVEVFVARDVDSCAHRRREHTRRVARSVQDAAGRRRRRRGPCSVSLPASDEQGTTDGRRQQGRQPPPGRARRGRARHEGGDRLRAPRPRQAAALRPPSGSSEPSTTVLVVGEFKQGKSTLVNALLNAPVCPVDDDIATAVPTVVRHGEEPRAWAISSAPARARGRRPVAHRARPPREPIAIEHLPQYVTEAGNPDNIRGPARRRGRHVPRQLLADGLTLVDTPGVGGLESSPRRDHPRRPAVGRGRRCSCPTRPRSTRRPSSTSCATPTSCARNLVCVLTKTDFYPEWRRIAEHRHAATSSGPASRAEVMPVSSTLRTHAVRADDKAAQHRVGLPQARDASCATA